MYQIDFRGIVLFSWQIYTKITLYSMDGFLAGPERERQFLADVRLVPRLPPRRLLLLLLLPHAGQ